MMQNIISRDVMANTRMLIPFLLLKLPSLGLCQSSVHGSEYLSLTASEKADRIWANCLTDTESASWYSTLKSSGLLLESMCPTLTTEGDEMKRGWFWGVRKKFIHTVGTVGRAEWRNKDNHPYTGIFKGSLNGIVRLSLAGKPDPPKLHTTPGMGLKFLKSGIDSSNLVAMNSVNGQESWNFFKLNFSNHIPRPSGNALAPLALKFSTATHNIQQVGLSDWASSGDDGLAVLNPVFPYRLRFQPTGLIAFSDVYVRPHTEDLVTIPNGSILYQVYALDAPVELGGVESHIADLVLSSEMITSKWGDSNLFFRHQDMADDLLLKPEWNRYTPKFEWRNTPSPPEKSGCH